jgi:hypothetical protein
LITLQLASSNAPQIHSAHATLGKSRTLAFNVRGCLACSSLSEATIRVYARVSTQDQSADMQLPDLQSLAGARGLEVEVFSGSAAVVAREHPGFDKMIAAAHRGRCGVLCGLVPGPAAPQHGRRSPDPHRLGRGAGADQDQRKDPGGS